MMMMVMMMMMMMMMTWSAFLKRMIPLSSMLSALRYDLVGKVS